MKIKFGYLTGADGGTTEDIIVKSALPNKAKDVLIGGGMILLGVAYLCYTAFKNGVNEAAIAEQRVYKNAGYLNEDGRVTVIMPDLAKQLKGEE